MSVTDSQRDVRRAFVGGGPGAFVSGVIWLAAAFVLTSRGVRPAFTVLFFGGMLIFPLSQILTRFVFRRAPASSTNVLGRIALESTFAMIAALLVAWLILPLRPGYVFPLAAIAVGTHYAAFRTLYGDILYWLLAALITGAGAIEILRPGSIPGGPAVAVGLIEIVFAAILTTRELRTPSAS